MSDNVSVNQHDKYTITMLKKAITHVDNKLNDKTANLDEATKKKLKGMKEKYQYQIGKTQNLYNKYLKKPETSHRLKGLSVNTLSVERIYQLIGKNTMSGSWTNDVGAWIRESPGRAVAVAGGGLAAIGAVLNLGGTGAKTALLNGLTNMFGQLSGWQAVGIPMLSVGALALGIGLLMNKLQKEKFKNAHLQAEAEEAMNKGTVRDNDTLRKATPEQIKELAAEAAADENLMQHLVDVIGNPFTPTDVAKNAQKILDQAKLMEQENLDRAVGIRVQSLIEAGTKEDSKKEALINFAVVEEVRRQVEAYKAGYAIKDTDVDTAKNAMDDAKKEVDKYKAEVDADPDKKIKVGTIEKTAKEWYEEALDKYKTAKEKYQDLSSKFNAAQTAKDKITEIKGEYPGIEIDLTKIDPSSRTGFKAGHEPKIDGKTFSEVELSGMEAVLEIAKESGVPGFSEIPADEADKKAKYDLLCRKYNAGNAIKNIAQVQLRMGSSEAEKS